MGELTTTDVETFTNGRLSEDDPEVQRLLDTALVIARREVGWYVSPVVLGDVVVLDGPNSRILTLPTRKLVGVTPFTSIKEDGVTLTLTDLTWSAGGPPGITERPISVRKKSRAFWSCDYQAIEVTMDHGYTEDEAADWRQAILTMVDEMGTMLLSGHADLELIRKTVDDVTYAWGAPYATAAQDALYSVKSILADYTLPRLEFL